MKIWILIFLTALTFSCNNQVNDLHFGPGPNDESSSATPVEEFRH